ncbi:MAG: hypothetical protein DSZ23_00295, partial [Thermodesulfatator sp.]
MAFLIICCRGSASCSITCLSRAVSVPLRESSTSLASFWQRSRTIRGYLLKREPTGNILMRITDIFMAFPRLILAMAIAAALGPSLTNVVSAISFGAWTVFARLARSRAIAVREEDFVEAARALGAGNLRRFWTVTLPSATPSILNAALMVFILNIDSFGIPAIIGVCTPVLTTLVYGEFTSEMGGPPVMASTGAT